MFTYLACRLLSFGLPTRRRSIMGSRPQTLVLLQRSKRLEQGEHRQGFIDALVDEPDLSAAGFVRAAAAAKKLEH